MKKVYTIEIQRVTKAGIWYANRNGEQFEAQLGTNISGSVVFKINAALFVFPIDCVIVSEKIVEPY